MVDDIKPIPLILCCICGKRYKAEDGSNISEVCHRCAVGDLRGAVQVIKTLRAKLAKFEQATDDRIETGGAE